MPSSLTRSKLIRARFLWLCLLSSSTIMSTNCTGGTNARLRLSGLWEEVVPVKSITTVGLDGPDDAMGLNGALDDPDDAVVLDAGLEGADDVAVFDVGFEGAGNAVIFKAFLEGADDVVVFDVGFEGGDDPEVFKAFLEDPGEMTGFDARTLRGCLCAASVAS